MVGWAGLLGFSGWFKMKHVGKEGAQKYRIHTGILEFGALCCMSKVYPQKIFDVNVAFGIPGSVS